MTTPPTNRPMTGEDAKLLKAGDVLKIVDADTFLTARGLKNGSLVTLRSLDGQWIDLADLPYPQGTSPYRFQFVSRPEPEPERDGAVERVQAALDRILPITSRDTPDYAELTFGESRTQAMTMEPDTWLALNDLRHVLSLLEEARGWKGEWEAVCSERIKDREKTQEIINGRDQWIVELIREKETAERQRDEAVRALEQVKNTTDHRTGYSDLSARRAAHKVSAEALQSIGSDR